MFVKFDVTENETKMQCPISENILGKPGTGIKIYPWSRLEPCKCGNRHPWIHGFPKTPTYNEIIEDGSRYRVVCHRCFRHTRKDLYRKVVDEWNKRMTEG